MGVGVEFRFVKGFVADFLYPSELDFPEILAFAKALSPIEWAIFCRITTEEFSNRAGPNEKFRFEGKTFISNASPSG